MFDNDMITDFNYVSDNKKQQRGTLQCISSVQLNIILCMYGFH